MNGWIKIHRKILKWGWFTDVNTSHFWWYCLLKANIEDAEYKGIKVKRGEFVAPLRTMAKESGLTTRGVRTALEHLKSTQEVTLKVTQHGTLVHIVKFGNYQDKHMQTDTKNDTKSDKQVTQDRHKTDTHPSKEEEKEIKEDIRISSSNNNYKFKNTKNKNSDGEKMMMNNIPTLSQVQEYFLEQGMKSNPEEFYKYNQEFDWKDKNGKPISSWKRAAKGWERSYQKYGARHSTNTTQQKVGVPSYMKEQKRSKKEILEELNQWAEENNVIRKNNKSN
ncbi:hypothetical protein [Pseudobutyrivibrio sp.]